MFKLTDLKAQPVVSLCSVVILLSLLCTVGAGDEDQDLPGPEKKTLKTKDGVALVCDYYPGNNGKETVPILMVHGWGGVRGEFTNLARTLQQDFGHAVIVPDLRGHGDSVRYTNLNGEEKLIDPKRMNRKELAGMFQFDLETVKKFLVRKNNEEKLNVDLLCIVGVQMGAIVGMNWAVLDWSWPALTGIKQGQDVKAFVLVSPVQAFKGIRMQPALNHSKVRRLSTMILVGEKDRKGLKQARQLNSSLKRFHLPAPGESEEKAGTKSLFLVDFGTSLKGTKLLDAPVSNKKLGPHDWIAGFIRLRLQNKQDEHPWRKRG
ncbi:MAG: hypothetical protein CMJ81_10130 [Planctomycetaceae bacterium]|nr:hypothetical protein [Planctomycetaceae bacterium]